MSSVRETVLSSLAAVGANHEAQFYAELFAGQEPERFALVVIDPRCLKTPLLEALTSDIRILSNLELTPVLLVGALDEDRTSVKFQAQRLAKELEHSHIKVAKLNTATYALIGEVRKQCKAGRVPILEMTERRGRMSLVGLARELNPNKVLFLQPSGGLSSGGRRLHNMTLEEVPILMEREPLSVGQVGFLNSVKELAEDAKSRRSYVIASPLNLLSELFTTKGSGTLIRRAVKIKTPKKISKREQKKLSEAMNEAFGKELDRAFFERKLFKIFLEQDLQGGALFTQLAGLPYLSKFWVSRAARGEGIARDLWAEIIADVPAFFWRSRLDNPFNSWYMSACDGMQRSGDWRVFWIGLDAPEVPAAILAAGSAPDDFVSS